MVNHQFRGPPGDFAGKSDALLQVCLRVLVLAGVRVYL